MKVVYVSGPYRNATVRGMVENIRKAETLAIEVWRMGAACICPHLNTAFLDGSCPDDVWLEGDLEIIRRCDALLMVDGWFNSEGARMEHLLAEKLKLPIFRNIAQLQNWLEAERSRT